MTMHAGARNGTTVSRYWSGAQGLAAVRRGSRGAMEVGFYQALTECGVRADMVLGSSIGALNGAYIAGGIAAPRLIELWREFRLRQAVSLNWDWLRHGAAAGLLARPATGHAAPNLAGHAIRAARDPAHDRHHRSAVGFRVLLVRTGDLIGP